MIKYCIIGAGGTGGALAAYMAKAGKDVSLIARGEHLKKIQQDGLRLIRLHDEWTVNIKTYDQDDYQDHPDVIFVCVKGYSIDEIIPFIKRAANSDTVVIPILNIYSTGSYMQKLLPDLLVTDGCIYIASQKKAPGVILMSGDILRVVFGVRDHKDARPILKQIKEDLDDSHIDGILSDAIRADALLKFSYVSPQGACGLYYNIPAGPMQKEGKYREMFKELVHEVDLLANAQGIVFDEDIVKRNLKILDTLTPDMTTSLQKDIARGSQSEFDGLITQVVKDAKQFNVAVPMYEKIVEKFKSEA